jgi:hypothetical protein
LCPWSEKIPIFVGANQQRFYVDKCLLQLHSGLFRNKLADLEEIDSEQKPLSLPEVDPGTFAEFVCWMRVGDWLPAEPEILHSNPLVVGCSCWNLGRVLESAGFQNFLMCEEFYAYGLDEAFNWPAVEDVRSVYKVLGNGSKLRKFTADSVAFKNPFERFSEGDEAYDAWCQLFKDFPELGLDVAKATGKGNGKPPWNEDNIGKYMEEEIDLNKSWEEMILKARTRAEIEKEARDGCVRSKVELDHINRGQEVNPE